MLWRNALVPKVVKLKTKQAYLEIHFKSLVKAKLNACYFIDVKAKALSQMFT